MKLVFVKLDKLIIKFIWKYKGSMIPETFLSKNKIWGLALIENYKLLIINYKVTTVYNLVLMKG